MAIALHADQNGWAWPKVSTISKETGYDGNTVHKALNKLCKVKVRGHRVLLRAKEPPAYYIPDQKDKNYTRNFYLLFPSADEITRLEEKSDDESNHIAKTVSTKSESFLLDTKNMDTVFARQSLNTEEEPVIKKNHNEKADPHPQQEPTAPPTQALTLFDVPQQSQANGGGGSRFTVSQNIEFARCRAAQGAKIDPEAVGRARFRDGLDDELLAEHLNRTPEQIAEERAAPANQNLFYGEALDIIRSLIAVGRDPLEIIREMPLDDDVRQRLNEKFAQVAQ